MENDDPFLEVHRHLRRIEAKLNATLGILGVILVFGVIKIGTDFFRDQLGWENWLAFIVAAAVAMTAIAGIERDIRRNSN